MGTDFFSSCHRMSIDSWKFSARNNALLLSNPLQSHSLAAEVSTLSGLAAA